MSVMSSWQGIASLNFKEHGKIQLFLALSHGRPLTAI
jgi:hypothetical protein